MGLKSYSATTTHSDANIAAIEAARVAIELTTHAEYSQKMVFATSEFNDIYAAINAAQDARRTSPTPIKHHTVHIAASNTIHGVVMDLDSVDWPDDEMGIITCVVTTTSTYPLVPHSTVQLDMVHQIHELINVTTVDHDIYINEFIHVIDDGPKQKSESR